MYTQCPECGTALRVTADVLKQAAGKVRCGRCHSAFNALLYLSETKPESKQRVTPDNGLPKVVPEVPAPGQDHDLPASRAGTAAADEFSGHTESDGIRFEDTGVEWRLVGGHDEGENDDQTADDVESEWFEGSPEAALDEVLEDAPTPVDEFLTDSPGDVEAAEVFSEDSQAENAVEALDIFEAGDADVRHTRRPEDELRFDDNTGLPDDFFDDPPASVSASGAGAEMLAKEAPEEPAAVPEVEHVEIAFGDAEDWGELLAEVSPQRPQPVPGFAEDDVDDDITGINELGSTGDEPMTLADELDALPDDGEQVENDGLAESSPHSRPDVPLDLDTQFNLQALSMGIELTGSRPADAPSADAAEEAGAEPALQPDSATALADRDDAEVVTGTESETALEEETGVEAEPAVTSSFAGDLAGDRDVDFDQLDWSGVEPVIEDPELEESLSLALEAEDGEDDAPPPLALVEVEAQAEPGDADDAAAFSIPKDTGELQFEIEKAQLAHEDAGDDPFAPEAQHVPEPTEEEQTVNMLIDEDLMRLAITDDEGMTATIVFENQSASKRKDKDAEVSESESESDTMDFPDEGTGFETIIMEGEFARTALEQKRLSAEREARDEQDAAAAAAVAQQQQANAGGNRRRHYGIIAGIVVLFLLLAGQFVHQSRAALATIPAIGDAIEPVYRAVGAPIAPDWDITGWRFEATRGSTDPGALAGKLLAENGGVAIPAEAEGDANGAEILTVYSRIGNQSENALPYPLISIALTDRFEETIGSKVLDPADYLPSGISPAAFVAAGETFDAVIRLASPSARATGFKLNVCYRQSDERLRCAIEDFR